MKKILFAILVLIPLVAFARPVSIKTQSDFSPLETSTVALAKNKDRKGLIISNKGTDNILVKFGAVHTSNEGMDIDNGVTVQFEEVPMDSLYIKLRASTGTNSVGILEFE